jgi:hypothetical protein
MLFGMMFFGWLPFLLLFLFVVAIRGVFRALGIFRRRGTDELGDRFARGQIRSWDFGDLGAAPVIKPSLENRIFRLAARLGGRVTISDVVIDTELSVAEAERFMDRLVDGTRVRMEVTDEGMVVYEFPELLSRGT